MYTSLSDIQMFIWVVCPVLYVCWVVTRYGFFGDVFEKLCDVQISCFQWIRNAFLNCAFDQKPKHAQPCKGKPVLKGLRIGKILNI